MFSFLRNRRTGLVESARFALDHKSDGHMCPGCDAPMYPAESSRGLAHGKLFPGGEHAENCPCRALERSRSYIDLDAIDIDYLDKTIMTPVKIGGGDGGGGYPGLPQKDEEKLVRLGDLKSIYQSGLCEVKDFLVNGKIWLHDIVLGKRLAHRVMTGNAAIGRKVIVAKPDYVIESAMIIRFSVYSSLKVGCEWKLCQKIFDMKFHDQIEFRKTVKKLFVVTHDNRVRWKSRYSEVLLYGDWHALSKGDCGTHCKKKCHGKWRCTGYQYADCTVPAHQIFCPPINRV